MSSAHSHMCNPSHLLYVPMNVDGMWGRGDSERARAHARARAREREREKEKCGWGGREWKVEGKIERWKKRDKCGLYA